MQTAVYTNLAAGKPGDLFDNSPRRIDPFMLLNNTAGSGAPKVGCYFSISPTDPTQAILGYVEGSTLGGILVNANQYANWNNLSPSLELPQYTLGDIASFARVYVKVAHNVTIGYLGCYNNTDGSIGAAASATSVPEGYTLIPNSRFILTNASANGLAILELGD